MNSRFIFSSSIFQFIFYSFILSYFYTVSPSNLSNSVLLYILSYCTFVCMFYSFYISPYPVIYYSPDQSLLSVFSSISIYSITHPRHTNTCGYKHDNCPHAHTCTNAYIPLFWCSSVSTFMYSCMLFFSFYHIHAYTQRDTQTQRHTDTHNGY